MSRSYKRTPIVKDNPKARKFFKRRANKKVRRTPDIPNGRAYRKVYDSWSIYDFISYCTLEDWLDSAKEAENYFTKKDWLKIYYWK